jgi:hypothetical protein
MASRAWLWIIDLFRFCETEGKVIKEKVLERGAKRVGNGGKRGEGVNVARNRKVEETKREEGCGCECEDCCEKEGEEEKEERKEEWWESWVEV